jgi:gluconate 5-dehydrogenase
MKGHTVHEALLDVTDEKAVQDAFARLDDADIEIDILVNNAGIQLRKPILDLRLPEWQQVIDTNLTSAFLVGREALAG